MGDTYFIWCFAIETATETKTAKYKQYNHCSILVLAKNKTFVNLNLINKHMNPSELRKYIQALNIHDNSENIWNSTNVLNKINDALCSLKFSGPHHDEWQNQPCVNWVRIVKNDPMVKVWFALCKRNFNVDVWVCVTVGSDDLSLFEYLDDPPATVSAVMFSVDQAIEIAKQKLREVQLLTMPVKKQ